MVICFLEKGLNVQYEWRKVGTEPFGLFYVLAINLL